MGGVRGRSGCTAQGRHTRDSQAQGRRTRERLHAQGRAGRCKLGFSRLARSRRERHHGMRRRQHACLCMHAWLQSLARVNECAATARPGQVPPPCPASPVQHDSLAAHVGGRRCGRHLQHGRGHVCQRLAHRGRVRSGLGVGKRQGGPAPGCRHGRVLLGAGNVRGKQRKGLARPALAGHHPACTGGGGVGSSAVARRPAGQHGDGCMGQRRRLHLPTKQLSGCEPGTCHPPTHHCWQPQGTRRLRWRG